MTRRTRASALLLLAFAIVAPTGCGDDGDDNASASSTSTTPTLPPGEASPATVPPGGATGGSPTTSTTSRPGAAPSAPATTADTQSPPSEFPVKVSFAHSCINVGMTQIIRFETVAGAGIAYVVEFSDGQAHEATGGGVADNRGHFEDSFTIQAGAPNGTATAHVSATSGDRRSAAKHSFTVGC